MRFKIWLELMEPNFSTTKDPANLIIPNVAGDDDDNADLPIYMKSHKATAAFPVDKPAKFKKKNLKSK